MGKIFNSNTWRTPLQLIDCWLPLPAERRVRPTVPFATTGAVQRFSRAGWLNKEASNDAVSQTRQTSLASSANTLQCRVGVQRRAEAHGYPSRDLRLVISGPIGDVCAELDRLVALEQQGPAHVR